ncbi:hypothetical protein [Nocardioides lianchengensis]|uniref:Uncharacterized protein n=1 Tax=Nocardioides lianchengensis TaxID=1045774 RepID=A0A1G6JLD1_9ACTN|nr:hypothetical protein [Nocardioides lianchengensis]NYG08711.1 hypothetical protein [Nocardioides lianchengensis]SDC19559.1 hypothetical protein SAMN05421872_101516 [Nocardioides lianchengensis]
MLMSGRAATRRLQAAGLTERSARRVLAAGLAGEPQRITAAHLYDEESVERLAERSTIAWSQLREACPHGVFVARRPGPPADLEDGWPMSLAARFWVDHGIAQHGCFPLVATVAGFVSTGAEIVASHDEPVAAPAPSRTGLTLRPPGGWYDAFRDRRLSTGPGPAWLLLNVPGWISASGAA